MKRALTASLLAILLNACASVREEDSNTLKSLAQKRMTVEREQPVPGNRGKAIDAYRHYLDIAPRDARRPEAMRRLGDMEIESAEQDAASGAKLKQNDYKRAVGVYQSLLRS